MRFVSFSAFTLLLIPATAAPVDFVRDVRPILEKNCYECHGAEKQKSGLRLDVKAAAFHGGDGSAPNILPGRAAESTLIKFITAADADDRMPPKGDGLSPTEIATLTAWINEGAIWPDGVDTAKLEDRLDHWSFKPLTNPTPPATKNIAWPRNAIDRFILARLEHEGLAPSPAADRVAWLRRVSFDLTGLPPTPEQVARFAADRGKDAPERLVDELLQSPRYGERWAQHWLDVVRYADTHGFEVNTERPNAWPYRDYVIRALNQDTSYDQFIKEQLVGDALGEDAATGFLVTASVLLPGQIGKDEPSKRLARQDAVDEMVTNIGQTFLGLSVSCARCHDHKFDPITARDYYSMQAFVAGVEYQDRPLRTPEAEAARKEAAEIKREVTAIEKRLAALTPLAKSGVERPMVNARENVDRFTPTPAWRVRFTILTTNDNAPCIDELEIFGEAGDNFALETAGATVKSSGDHVVTQRSELRFLNDGRYGNLRTWISNEKGKGWVVIEFPREQVIDRVVWSRDRLGKSFDRLATDYTIEVGDEMGMWRVVADASDRKKFDSKNKKAPDAKTDGLSPEDQALAKELTAQKKKLDARITETTNRQNVFAGKFREPDRIHLLARGDPEQPKDAVVPAVLSALGDLKLPADCAEQERRRVLADWIASPQNPLTARVMVNRIWQGHFGTGLVDTPSDFGRMGTRPSHPELLDWLAAEFIRSGWSVKHMHRLMVLSATYGQQSGVDPIAQAKDADARLLWRYPARRLEAEAIRDTMLAVSGRLNLGMYGRGFDLFDKRGGLSGFIPVEEPRGEQLRRMVYAHKVRREREAVFGSFDCPDAGQSTARRRESTTPIQALNLFNSRFTLAESEAFATEVAREAGVDPARQIALAYQRALGRTPTDEELSDVAPVVRAHGLAALGRALFNSNEFLFLP
jgi:mono/diheme cytochrome c family protein